MVRGVGPKNAKIVIVGEAPGREEELKGEPFVGSSGHLLNEMLAKVGIDRKACYITNVVKTRPPNNKFKEFFYEDKRGFKPNQQLELARIELGKELEEIRPMVILALGEEALRAVTGKYGISSWRGSILSTRFGKVIPSFHPAYILRMYGDRPIAELDLKRVREESSDPIVPIIPYKFEIDPSFTQTIERLKWLNGQKTLSFDIETTRKGLIRCIGLAWTNLNAITIPFIVSSQRIAPGITTLFLNPGEESLNSRWSKEEEIEILKELNTLLGNINIRKIAQNAPFDITVLEREFGIRVLGEVNDTMHMAHVAYPEFPKGLDFLASIYTKTPYWSDYDAASDIETWKYNATDVAVTFEVFEKLTLELQQSGLRYFYQNHIRPSSAAYSRAQNRGFKIDEEERQKQKKVLECELEGLAEKVKTFAANPDFNPRSPKQLAELLYKKLGIPAQVHHKTGNVTADKNAMERLRGKFPVYTDLFQAIEDFQSLKQVLSNFFSLELPNERIYTSYNLSGAVTGRLSSSSSFVYEHNDWGSCNLQNIRRSPELDRKCFVAEDGWSVIKADLKMAELYCVAWYANIEWLQERLITDPTFDIHRWLASKIFLKPESDIVKRERDIAKNGVYGGNYDMGVQTASRTYKLPYLQAKHVLETHRRAIPEIPKWWREVQNTLNNTRTLSNPLGRERIFFDRPGPDMYRAGYSWLCQSLVGDIITKAFREADQCFKVDECQLRLQVHDEIVCVCRDEHVVRYNELLERIMTIPITFEGISTQMVIPVDVSVGKNWLDCKTITPGTALGIGATLAAKPASSETPGR